MNTGFKTIIASLKDFLSDHKFNLLITLLSLIILLSWALIVPFGKAPDERAHFGLMYFIAQNHYIPVAGEVRLTEAIGRYSNFYGALPVLSYVLGALGIVIGSSIKIGQLYIYARFVSVLFGIGTVLLSYSIAKKIFPENILIQKCVPLTVLLIPQSSFIFSYTNNDSLAIFAVTMFFYSLILLREEISNYRKSIILGLSLGLCLLSKLNAYIVIPLFLIYILMVINRNNWKPVIRSAAISGLIAICISGWWFIRNYLLYNGDILALKASKLTSIIGYREKGWPLTKFLLETPWAKSTFVSSWAAFDHLNVILPIWYYVFILFLVIASVLGSLSTFIRKNANSNMNVNNNKCYYVIFIFSILFSIALSVWNSYTNDYQPQGKYLYTSLIPCVILFLYGLQGLVNIFSDKTLYKSLTMVALVVAFLIFNIFSLIFLYRLYHGL